MDQFCHKLFLNEYTAFEQKKRLYKQYKWQRTRFVTPVTNFWGGKPPLYFYINFSKGKGCNL